jgi:hypothetical protein
MLKQNLSIPKKNIMRLFQKVGRSQRTDEEAFYKLHTYKDDVDLEEKPLTGSGSIIYPDPTATSRGKEPYETFRKTINSQRNVFSGRPDHKVKNRRSGPNLVW